jgi:YfiH family protein
MARLLFTSKYLNSFADPVSSSQVSALEKLIGKPVQFMQQTHSNHLCVTTAKSSAIEDTDSLITENTSLALAVRIADCIPLLLYSSNMVAAVHVGRKGLLNQVAARTVQKMYELGATQIKGVAGPHICGNCYEVGKDMANEIVKSHPETFSKEGHINLFNGLQAQISNVELINLNLCTVENERFFSYRANKDSGRQLGVISL